MSRRTGVVLGAVLVLLLVLAGWLVFRRPPAGLGQGAAPPQGTARARIIGGNAPPEPRVQPDLESLDGQALAQAADYAGSQGSRALIVSRHSHIVFERYWGGTGFDTVVDAQSFTPLLAALATGAALSRRELAFPDEPVGFVLVEWRNDPRGAITLRHLLTMSSGLGAAGAADSYGTDIAAALSQPLTAKPGERWLPRGADPQLLSLVLTRATHMPYADYLSQTLWRRLGAGDAWLQLDRPGGSARADCCLQARQGDWIRVAELLLKDGNYRGSELIRPGWTAQMARPAAGNPDYGAYMRLGGQTGTEAYATPLWVVGGPAGNPGGNRLWVVPSLGIAIVRTADKAGNGWDDSRIPNLIIRGAKDFVAPSPHGGNDLSRLVPQH